MAVDMSLVDAVTRRRNEIIERACAEALIQGCGVTVDDTEGWARPDHGVHYGRMEVRGYPSLGSWWAPPEENVLI